MFNQPYNYQQMFYYPQMQPFVTYFVYPQQFQQTNPISEQIGNDQRSQNLEVVVKQCHEETNIQEVNDSNQFVIGNHTSSEDDEDFEILGLKDQKEKCYSVNQLNASTNIQKNYAKAAIQYIKQQNQFIINTLGEKKTFKFFQLLKKFQNKISNLSHIRKYTKDEDYLKLFRMLINKFLNKDCICYIYNSKIKLKTSHLKGKHMIKKSLVKI